MKEYLFQHSLRTILTQAVSSRPPQPGKGGKKTKNVSLGGDSNVCTPRLVHVKTWIEGWGHGEGICQVWGMESKCERHKTERSESPQLTKSPKKNKKRAACPKNFFFRSDGHTLTRTSEPSRREPRLDLWTTDRPRFGLDPCHSLL